MSLYPSDLEDSLGGCERRRLSKHKKLPMSIMLQGTNNHTGRGLDGAFLEGMLFHNCPLTGIAWLPL